MPWLLPRARAMLTKSKSEVLPSGMAPIAPPDAPLSLRLRLPLFGIAA